MYLSNLGLLLGMFIQEGKRYIPTINRSSPQTPFIVYNYILLVSMTCSNEEIQTYYVPKYTKQLYDRPTIKKKS